MKAVIHQSFGDVFDFDASALPLAQIDDAFVRDEPAFSFEENGEITIEPLRDVVRIQDRDLRGFREAFSAHHPDVHPGNGQDAGAAVRSGGDGADSILDNEFSIFDRERAGRNGTRCLATPMGPTPGPPPP